MAYVMCYVIICNCSFVIEAPHSKLFPVIATPEKMIQKNSGASESVIIKESMPY